VVEGEFEMTATIQDVEELALRVQEACKAVHGGTKGHCREAAIILAELLLERRLVEWVSVSQGYYAAYGHFWVRIRVANVSWLVDPTFDQFGSSASLLTQEGTGELYKEEAYLLFTTRLSELRKQVKAA